MGLQRCYSLTDEQVLAIYLYSKEKEREWPIMAPCISMIINTVHPESPRLHDIAGDFTRYAAKDPLLAECLEAARAALNGGTHEPL